MYQTSELTADKLYADVLWTFKGEAQEEDTRNGKVLVQPGISVITLLDPRQRILYNPDRDANPFFHLMETIWMWAGREDLKWIEQFNSNIYRYAEDREYFHGAYGYRWRKAFGVDQLVELSKNIKDNPTSRQHVLTMWAIADLMVKDMKDYPCNTSIYFRVVRNKLNMTVLNRSNDLIWGALGANIVHMTMLHELMAASTDLDLGTYFVMSNNLHVYEKHWPLLEKRAKADVWASRKQPTPERLDVGCAHIPMEKWLDAAELFCADSKVLHYPWFKEVAQPMKLAYLDRENRFKHLEEVKCPAWRKAGELWAERRKKND